MGSWEGQGEEQQGCGRRNSEEAGGEGEEGEGWSGVGLGEVR